MVFPKEQQHLSFPTDTKELVTPIPIFYMPQEGTLMIDPKHEKYRGSRVLILTRVSTPQQKEKYSHPAQERKVREQLVTPLGQRVVKVINDTYSGLEYHYREALDEILEMAERGEFDVLCMDVLDRGLGRKAIARELFRMQLRELGIGILTTDPSDHADDDSLEGQIMRFFKGTKAEEEVADFVRRSRDGKREKALGDKERGRPQQIIGTGERLYGYKFVLNEKGTRVGYTLNLDIIYVEPDGTEWTEVKVIVFIFVQAAKGISTHKLAQILNEKGIPTPGQAKDRTKRKRKKEELKWQRTTISHFLKQTAYYGEYHQFKRQTVGKVPGHKTPYKRRTTPEEQVIIPIPAIIQKSLYDKANKRLATSQWLSPRNNRMEKESLMRGGLAKCGYCGSTARVRWTSTHKRGREYKYFFYNCDKPYIKEGKCKGCSTMVDTVDNGVKEYILALIRNPSEVDLKIQELQKKNPPDERQEKKVKDLNAIVQKQKNYRRNLAAELEKETVSSDTLAFLTANLAMLEKQEEEARADLADRQKMQREQEELQARIAAFHQQCDEWGEKLDDPEFMPTFAFFLDAVLFFGITVTIYRRSDQDHTDRYLIHTDPPDLLNCGQSLLILTSSKPSSQTT